MTFHVDEQPARLPGPTNPLWPSGARSVSALRHGSMELELYAPDGTDPQQPHGQDEPYVVQRGHGRFACGGAEVGFAPGDVLFVRAGQPHRCTRCSDDFATRVVSRGARGGEQR